MLFEARANDGLHDYVLSKVQEVSKGSTTLIRVLDFGCGTGSFFQRLKESGYNNLTGVDITRSASFPSSLNLFTLDLDRSALPFLDESFDLITMIEVLEHMENIGNTLAELHRVTAPDGYIIITTPNLHSIECRLRYLLLDKMKQFDEKGDPTHITPIILHPFLKLLDRYQFKVLEVCTHRRDGFSPTSRPMFRLLTGVLRRFGIRAKYPGDNLCLVLQRNAKDSRDQDKIELVVGHYQQ